MILFLIRVSSKRPLIRALKFLFCLTGKNPVWNEKLLIPWHWYLSVFSRNMVNSSQRGASGAAAAILEVYILDRNELLKDTFMAKGSVCVSDVLGTFSAPSSQPLIRQLTVELNNQRGRATSAKLLIDLTFRPAASLSDAPGELV